MELLGTIKDNRDLHKKVMGFCDIEIYPEIKKPEDMNGAMVYNMDGRALGCDGSGGEYILLNDNTIGFSSSEGECGRLAENEIELFELLLNISSFFDYNFVDLYADDELLKKYMTKREKDHVEFYNKNRIGDEKYENMQKYLSEKLSIKLYDNKFELLKRFHKTATREPQYSYIFTEKDGTKTNSEGSLICRPLYEHVKKRMGL